MRCKFTNLRCKEVINICDGCRLGYVSDVELDTATSCIITLIVPGPAKFFGLFGREDDYVIPWAAIKKIGEDIILIECEFRSPGEKKEKHGWFWSE